MKIKMTKITTLFLVAILAISCSSKNEFPVSVDHAACLFEFVFSDISQPNGKEIYTKDCSGMWKWKLDDRWNISKENGFSYRIEFNEGDMYVINMVYDSPGTGVFTKLLLIEIKADTYKLIETIAGGDRCQHGIVSADVKYEEGNLFYSEQITPLHLMRWFNSELPANAYDDCMVCCVGSVMYKYNPISRIKEFVQVELSPDKSTGNDSFSTTYNDFILKGRTVLKEEDIKDFIYNVEH